MEVLGLGLSLDKLDIANLSFCTIVTLFRGLLANFLDELLLYYSDGNNNYVKTKQSTALLMEGSSSEHSSSITDQHLAKIKKASNTLSEAFYTLRELEKLKSSANIRVIETKLGGLDIEVAGDMSQEKAEEITDKVFSLEAKYNSNIESYKELIKESKKSGFPTLGEHYKKLYQEVLNERAKVYEKES